MKTSHVVLTSLSILGAAGIGYALYFDHRRRTDASFRKGLRKDSKKISKASKKDAAKRAKEEEKIVEEFLLQIRTPEFFPSGVEEREQYFLQHVSIGEQLFAQGLDQYLEASMAFFKALKVYPAPVELIMIYQKAIPKEVFDCIMRIVSKDVATGSDGDNLDDVDDSLPSAKSKIQVIDDEQKDSLKQTTASATATDTQETTSAASAQPTTTTAQPQTTLHNGTDSGTTSSQDWDTLSATSLTDTGVIVTPNVASSTSNLEASTEIVEPTVTETTSVTDSTLAEPTSTESTKEEQNEEEQQQQQQETEFVESEKTVESLSPSRSKVDFTSSWSPAPVFKVDEKAEQTVESESEPEKTEQQQEEDQQTN